MVAVTANYSTQVSGSLREDLSNIITTIDPTETPVSANLATVDISNPEGFEWQIDSLAAASDAGVVDGVAFSALTSAVSTRTRLKARCQIQVKAFSISNRKEETDTAGVDSEIAYQLALRSEELQRDREKSILTFRTPVASASGTAPLVAGIPTWIRTNRDAGGGGADPTLSGSEPVVGTDGTARALDESLIKTLFQGSYNAGGNIDMGVLPVAAKAAFSTYMFGNDARIATPYQDYGSTISSGIQVVGAVDYYTSDFSKIALVPNRFQRSTDSLFLDTSLFELGVFRGYQVIEMGVTGDRQDFMVLNDFTVISRNEAGSANFADTDGTLAMVA